LSLPIRFITFENLTWMNHPRNQNGFYIMSRWNSGLCVRWVWKYQRGNQNPYIEEELTTQWPKEKVQKDKQRSTKHTHKTKDRLTRTPLKTGGKLRCFGRVSRFCSTRHYSILFNNKNKLWYKYWNEYVCMKIFSLMIFEVLM
jgi:hypothetical protein